MRRELKRFLYWATLIAISYYVIFIVMLMALMTFLHMPY